MDKLIKDLIRQTTDAGWTYKKTKKGHVQFKSVENSEDIVLVSHTPSDYRAIQKIKADFKRVGLLVNI